MNRSPYMTVKEGQRYLEMSRSGFVKWRKRHGIAKCRRYANNWCGLRSSARNSGYPVETPTPRSLRITART